MSESQARTLVALIAIAVALGVGAALRATYIVTMPLVFAFFVSVLVWPLHEGMRSRLPEGLTWIGTVATILAIIVALSGLVTAASFIVYGIASQRGGEIVAEAVGRWYAFVEQLAARGFPVPADEPNNLMDAVTGWLGTAALSLTDVLAAAALVVFFTLLMLVEAHHWKEKSRKSLPRARIGEVMTAISRQVRAFLLVQAFVASVTAGVTGLWLWALGGPFVLLWTLLTFLLDFVPNVGPTVAGILISLVAAVTLGWERALVTAVGILAIQQFFGTYVDPTLKGRRMDISPLVTLLAVMFWGWVWGVAGAIIAVPVTATLIIACANVPQLRPIALMLAHTADEEKLDQQTGTA